MTTRSVLFGVARAFLGFIFLWAFLDKTFGFGLATKAADAWIRGGSPTTGFLSRAVTGPLAGVFHSLAGSAVVDWLFMAGLLFVGLTLLANRFVRWGSVVGIGMLALMYLALLWPANNPFIDEHLVYIVLLGLIAVEAKHS